MKGTGIEPSALHVSVQHPLERGLLSLSPFDRCGTSEVQTPAQDHTSGKRGASGPGAPASPTSPAPSCRQLQPWQLLRTQGVVPIPGFYHSPHCLRVKGEGAEPLGMVRPRGWVGAGCPDPKALETLASLQLVEFQL